MPVQTIPELFQAAVRDLPRPDCFSFPGEDGRYQDISSAEAMHRVQAIRRGLLSLGIKPGEKIAILSENRLEWALTDLGALCSGCITVPIYPTLLPETIAYILKDSRPAAIFVSTPEQAAKIQPLREQMDFLREVISFEPTTLPNTLTFSKLLQIGQNLVEQNPPLPAEECEPVDPHSPCSIIYTSGTTGNPKGVVLSHWNFVSNVQAIREIISFNPDDRCLSFLPLSHVLERMAGFYTTLSAGVGIAYARRMDSVPEDILTIKPTILISVPRLYEKIYAKVLSMAMAAGFPRKNIFFWARGLGMRAAEMRSEGIKPSGWMNFQLKIADTLVFKKLRAKLGGNIRFMVSGGAPLNSRINKFFNAAGMTILEGYGLTETSPVLTCNNFGAIRFGSVGKAVPGTEIRIAEDGEIMARGPQIMLEYFNNEEATREILAEDGWLATGDIGHLDQEGYLFITDRKKDLIVTAGGKNIAPQPIENAFVSDKFVAQIVVIGDRRQFLSALIIPDLENLHMFATAAGIATEDDEQLLADPKIQQLFNDLVTKHNRNLPGFSQIKKFTLLAHEFTLEGGDLTPTMKVKRFAIARKYADIIANMYPATPEVE